MDFAMQSDWKSMELSILFFKVQRSIIYCDVFMSIIILSQQTV